MTLSDYFYPNFVREFYANVDSKNKHSEWFFKGQEILLTRDILTMLLGRANNGPYVDSIRKFNWKEDSLPQRASTRFGLTYNVSRFDSPQVLRAEKLNA